MIAAELANLCHGGKAKIAERQHARDAAIEAAKRRYLEAKAAALKARERDTEALRLKLEAMASTNARPRDTHKAE